MIPFAYLFFFSFKSYTASFAPVDCSEIPLSFNGFSCVAHNIANATPTSKLHTARMFKTSLACGRFLNFSTTRLACGFLSISCNNTIVRPNILGATSLLQPTKYRSQIRTQYPHSWHGLTLKSCDPHVRKNEVMPVAARHSMPWSNAIFKRRCQTVANGCQPRNQGGFLRRSKLRSSDNRLLIVYAGSRLSGTSLDWSFDRCQNCVYSHQGTFPRKAV